MTMQYLHIGINGHVVALVPDMGQEVWRVKLRSENLWGSSHGRDVCVLEHQGLVFVGCNGHLYCLDAATGSRLWKNDLKGLGLNDVTLSIAGKSVQLTTTEIKRSD